MFKIKSIKIKPLSFFLSFFGSGYLPYMPGTWGSLSALILATLISLGLESFFLVPIAAVLFIISWPLIYLYHEKTKKHDNKEIVIDEVIGILITVSFIKFSVIGYLIGFLLFRFFDIFKIFPCNLIDKKQNSFSVLMDDVVAGIYAGIILWLMEYKFPMMF